MTFDRESVVANDLLTWNQEEGFLLFGWVLVEEGKGYYKRASNICEEGVVSIILDGY